MARNRHQPIPESVKTGLWTKPHIVPQNQPMRSVDLSHLSLSWILSYSLNENALVPVRVCSCKQSLPNLARSPCRYWSCCSENSIHSNRASHCRRGHLLWHSEATCPESWLRSRQDPHSKGIEQHGWCFLELEPWHSGGWCWCFSLWQSAEHHPGTVCSKACWKLARQQYHHDTAKSLASSKLLLQAPAAAYQGTCHVGSYHHRFSSNLHRRHKCLGILLPSRLRVDPSLQAAVGMHPGFWRLDYRLRGCKANHPACSSWSYCHRGMYTL